jgi:hypothetical protein
MPLMKNQSNKNAKKIIGYKPWDRWGLIFAVVEISEAG